MKLSERYNKVYVPNRSLEARKKVEDIGKNWKKYVFGYPLLVAASSTAVAFTALHAAKKLDNFFNNNPKPTTEYNLQEFRISGDTLTIGGSLVNGGDATHTQQYKIVGESSDYYNSPKDAEYRVVYAENDKGEPQILMQQPYNPWYSATANLRNVWEGEGVLDVSGDFFDHHEPQEIYNLRVGEFTENNPDIVMRVKESFAHPGQPNRNPKPIHLQKINK